MESRATITQGINATFPDNNQKFITAEKVRAFMDIMNDSKFNLIDDSLGDIAIDPSNPNLSLNEQITIIENNIQGVTEHLALESLIYGRMEFDAGNNTHDHDSFIKSDLYGDFTFDGETVSNIVSNTYTVTRFYTHNRVNDVFLGDISIYIEEDTTTYSFNEYQPSLTANFEPDGRLRLVLFATTAGTGKFRAKYMASVKGPN